VPRLHKPGATTTATAAGWEGAYFLRLATRAATQESHVEQERLQAARLVFEPALGLRLARARPLLPRPGLNTLCLPAECYRGLTADVFNLKFGNTLSRVYRCIQRTLNI
jgi:hypothetical protein